MGRTRKLAGVAGVVALTLAGCGERREPSQKPKPKPPTPATIEVSSPAFSDGATIGRVYTCDGEGTPPPLRWSRVPSGTRELVLVLEDPDARNRAFVHWIVLALPPSARDLPSGTKPATLRMGRGGSGKVGYQPPCPPPGDRAHRYLFQLYALRAPLGLAEGATIEPVRAGIARNVIAQGTLVGRYRR